MNILPVGSRSLLFGVHCFFIHPVVVTIAWRQLYGSWPSLREFVCILVHDLGYWGKTGMDSAEGETHPELGAKIAWWLFGREYYDLVLLHSRHYARHLGRSPSRLAWPDKLAVAVEPWWLYLPRARLSGELAEYRRTARGLIGESVSDRAWYLWLGGRFRRLAEEQGTGDLFLGNPPRITG